MVCRNNEIYKTPVACMHKRKQKVSVMMEIRFLVADLCVLGFLTSCFVRFVYIHDRKQ